MSGFTCLFEEAFPYAPLDLMVTFRVEGTYFGQSWEIDEIDVADKDDPKVWHRISSIGSQATLWELLRGHALRHEGVESIEQSIKDDREAAYYDYLELEAAE